MTERRQGLVIHFINRSGYHCRINKYMESDLVLVKAAVRLYPMLWITLEEVYDD